jgi:hypothetical protein
MIKYNCINRIFIKVRLYPFVARESGELSSQKSKCNQLLSYSNVKVQKNKDP